MILKKKNLKDFEGSQEIEKKAKKKERLEVAVNICLILLLGLTVTIIMTFNINSFPINLEVGSISLKDIKADLNYEIIDEKSTNKIKEEAGRSVLPVYDFDTTIENEVLAKIKEAFFKAETFFSEKADKKKNLSVEQTSQLESELTQILGEEIPDEYFKMALKAQFHPSLEKIISLLVSQILKKPIIHDIEDLPQDKEKGFVLRKLGLQDEQSEQVYKDASNILDLEQAYNQLDQFESTWLKDKLNLDFIDNSILTTSSIFVKNMIRTNVNYNGIETDNRRQKAQANIKNIIIKIKRGESIIRSGDRFEPWHLTVIEGIRIERSKTNRFLKFLGLFLFINIVLFIVYYYATKYVRKFHLNRKDLIFLGLNLVTFLLILRFGIFFGNTIKDALPFFVGNFTLYYILPVAAGAMLVRFMLNSELALIFAVIASVFSGIFLENNLELTLYYLIGGVYASHAISRVDKRATIVLSGFLTGIVNAITILSLNLIAHFTLAGQVDLEISIANVIAGILGGMMTSMTVMILSPIYEGLFNYTTDVRLLELANLSHPLLKQMLVRAPGTYHHSQMVGVLAEAGANAIGANSLLARVGAYYHDIGKMKKPQYFIENQSGENPHDKLAPSMSALIIEAHVKDGIEMGLEHKLPTRIIDMIPEHQGTKLIGYFYNKAKEMEDPDQGGRVDEKDYRYPGPKPQTREAGVMMLADTIEAAVRSMSDKSPSKIQGMVEKLVNQHFVDEQLDECDLTLKDLHAISQAFVKVLIGIYHHRVEYPESATPNQHMEIQSIRPKKTDNEQPLQTASNIKPLFKNKKS